VKITIADVAVFVAADTEAVDVRFTAVFAAVEDAVTDIADADAVVVTKVVKITKTSHTMKNRAKNSIAETKMENALADEVVAVVAEAVFAVVADVAAVVVAADVAVTKKKRRAMIKVPKKEAVTDRCRNTRMLLTEA